ncbi:MAG TPA: hypothetical protein VM695_09115 [Phycisphaerae bacterium]|nr:hypothetical protein [Phycisphaerae bacterium]
MMIRILICLVVASLAADSPASPASPASRAKTPPPIPTPVGGANSPSPSPPPKLVIQTGVLDAGAFAVKIPTGRYTAPKGGAPNYAVPGPIVAFRGADGAWRGHGYLETFGRLLRFEGKLANGSAELAYEFQDGKSYKVSLRVGKGAVLLDEQSDLGPRNLFVFDCYYGDWQPAAGFAVNLTGERHAFVYLPCYYDKAEVTINPAAALTGAAATGKAKVEETHGSVDVGAAAAPAPGRPEDRPGAAVVLSAEAARKDIAGFFCRDVGGWKNGDRMGIQLWQRRQLPGEPASRHFLGPETKSDSTPNPRTAGMLGESLYEGHVTIELNLGVGERKLGFAAVARPEKKADIPEAFKRAMRENR